MIKLQDFARECGVTDRQIQRLLKKYEEDLTGLYERKGSNGTWLTDEACEILRSKMKQLPPAVFTQDPRVKELEQAVAEQKALVAEAKLMAKDYWEQLKEKEKSMRLLIEQNNDLQLKAASVARLEADNEAARVKIAQAEKDAQKAQKELVDAQAAYEEDLRKKTDRIQSITQEKEEEVAAARREAVMAVEDRFRSMSLWEFLKEKRKKGNA